MAAIFKSAANYQPVINVWSTHWVTVSLEDDGHFVIVNNDSQSVILDTYLSQIQRVYDYYYALIITVEGKQYKLNFTRPVSVGKSLIFGGWYNWIAPYVNNPLAGVKQQWLDVFEQQGIKPYRDKIGRSVAIGIIVPLVIIGLFILGVYIFVIRK